MFEIINDIDKVLDFAEKNNIMSAPILVVDDEVMDYNKAIKWAKGE